jgi:hypothetical protein
VTTAALAAAELKAAMGMGGGVVSGGGPKRWVAKERCFAQWTDSKYYVARIDRISELSTYHVTFLDYGNTAEVTEAQLMPYVHAPGPMLRSGVLVRAVWPEDGLFYDAVIEGQSQRALPSSPRLRS